MKTYTKAFQELTKAGIFAKRKLADCRTCGWCEVPDNAIDAVFTTDQSEDTKEDGLYLDWQGDGEKIKSVLVGSGYKVVWNGKDNRRILIK